MPPGLLLWHKHGWLWQQKKNIISILVNWRFCEDHRKLNYIRRALVYHLDILTSLVKLGNKYRASGVCHIVYMLWSNNISPVTWHELLSLVHSCQINFLLSKIWLKSSYKSKTVPLLVCLCVCYFNKQITQRAVLSVLMDMVWFWYRTDRSFLKSDATWCYIRTESQMPNLCLLLNRKNK